MSTSIIKITFTEDLGISDIFQLNSVFYQSGLPVIINHHWVWGEVRTESYIVPVGNPTSINGESTAINFVEAASLDLDLSYFSITRVSNEVTILIENISVIWEFTLNGYTSTIIPIIDNYEGNLFYIESINYSNATNPCTHVQASIETSNLATLVNGVANSDNPFELELLRGSSYQIFCEDADGNIINETKTAPAILNSSNFNLNITQTPAGATLSISNSNSDGLDIEYSLDDVNYQTSNVFSSLLVGPYTLYVRDQLGCSFEKLFEIDEYQNSSPFFYISKSNSFRFAKRITFGDGANYKNDENTLSCEADVRLPYKEVQQFQSSDIITTQFKSNYKEILVNIVKEDLSEVSVPVVKKSQNIGQKDKRDARKYNLGNGKAGIYFLSGNVYNYDTGLTSGTYSLYGSLPYWGAEGNYINISGVWHLIESVIYDEQKNAEIIVIDEIYLGVESNIIVSSIFNYQNYEVYEFAIDMANYLGEKIRIRINNNSNVTEDVVHLSELINIKVKQPNTIEILYYNDDNTDVNYSTGIQHKIRIELQKKSGIKDFESEINKTDTNAFLISSEIYEGDEFLFEPVTKEIMRKIVQALAHKNVYIDEVGYVIKDDCEVEGPLEETNLYVVKAKMIKNGNVYNSNGSVEVVNGENLEVPSLISTENGFISY